MKTKDTIKKSGYTLVEIMVAVTLSLVLLIGVTDMFRNVGDTINETQATLNMTQNLNNTAMILRNDLSCDALDELAYKPSRIAAWIAAGRPSGNLPPGEGYLEIVEGMGAPYDVINHANPINAAGITLHDGLNGTLGTGETHTQGMHIPPHWTAYSATSTNVGDLTVGDTDDILAFTVNRDGNFRGLIDDGTTDGKLVESNKAEVTWFVRGNTLYRRVLLIIDNPTLLSDNGAQLAANYRKQDISVRINGANVDMNSLTDLADRRNRFGRPYSPTATFTSSFPFPIHGGGVSSSWYYLRMPTVEETVDSKWTTVPVLSRSSLTCNGNNMNLFPNTTSNPATWGDSSNSQYWDLWENPNGWSDLDPLTGSLSDPNDPTRNFVSTPRNIRAGEDIILTNVIGFDVKVWNPYWVPCYDPYPHAGGNQTPGATASTGDFWKWAPPQFIDLGQDHFFLTNNGETKKYPVNYRQDLTSVPSGITAYNNADSNRENVAGYGFTLKGRYSAFPTASNVRRVDPNSANLSDGDKWHLAEKLKDSSNPSDLNYWTGTPMACVFDSWSDVADYTTNAVNGRIPAPPYTEPLKGIQITIRCFEPQSGAIKQVRITRHFQP